MKTIRNSVFETNSSSCHVLTIMSEEEVQKVKNKEAFIFVPHYSSDSDYVADSEIIDKTRFIENVSKTVDTTLPEVIEFIDKEFEALKNGKYIDPYSYVDETLHLDEGPIYKAITDLEEHLIKCIHEESEESIIDAAKKKIVNNNTVYVTVWEKYC